MDFKQLSKHLIAEDDSDCYSYSDLVLLFNLKQLSLQWSPSSHFRRFPHNLRVLPLIFWNEPIYLYLLLCCIMQFTEYQIKLIVAVGIWTAHLCCWKRLFCQLGHNHCPWNSPLLVKSRLRPKWLCPIWIGIVHEVMFMFVLISQFISMTFSVGSRSVDFAHCRRPPNETKLVYYWLG